MSYGVFAHFYDSFTENVDYKGRALYFDQVLKRYGSDPKLILDLACGTGSLALALVDLGYEVIAADGSEEMLIEASAKIKDRNVTLLKQTMEELDLAYKVDGAICALDSINHLVDKTVVAAVFKRISLFVKSNGLLVFDVNTKYKHKEILADNCYVFEAEEVFCSWQNSYNPDDDSVEIFLDFFSEQSDGRYSRESEDFTEQFYSNQQLESALNEAGFEVLAVFGEDSFSPPTQTEQRLVYVSRLLL